MDKTINEIPEIAGETLGAYFAFYPWINSKILLPQDGEIVCVPGGIARYNNGTWYTGMEDPIYQRAIMWEVWCWMPLPKAPAHYRLDAEVIAKLNSFANALRKELK